MLDTQRLPAFVLEFTQQLVGGNSNLEAKLQAVVPGVFGSTGGIGQSSRRLINLRLAYSPQAEGFQLVATTLSRDGYQWFTYAKGETNSYFVLEGAINPQFVVTQEQWELQPALKLAYENVRQSIKLVALADEYWSGDDDFDFNVWRRPAFGQIFPGDSQWWVSGYRVKDGVTDTLACVWSAPLPESIASQIRAFSELELEGGGSTS